ncbi:MAG: EpsG family protein [Limimaricola soesokkakensis]|uniref:EpsG family protein n=1 Tax=Limimaricola soesokkakensis TaxID=1343159 RepID=UPI004059AC74
MVIRKSDALYAVAILAVSLVFGYIAGFRPFGIGMDFRNYQSFYDMMRPREALDYFRYEPGFVHLASEFKRLFSSDYMYFAAALSTAALAVKFSTLRNLRHPILTSLFYLAVWYPLHENTQVRVAFATSLLFVASQKMFEGRWAWFAGLAVASTLFHLTAAVGAAGLAIAFYLSRFDFKYALGYIVLCGAVLYASFAFVMRYAVQLQPLLLEQGGGSSPPTILSAANVAVLLFLISFILSGSANDLRRRTFFIMTAIGFVLFFVFLPVPVMAQRFRELFFVFMTFIAFDYRIGSRTLLQASLAFILAGWSLYSSISYGLFSD